MKFGVNDVGLVSVFKNRRFGKNCTVGSGDGF